MVKQPAKRRSTAEIAWRKQYSDERWENHRVPYLMEFFSQPSALLPRPPGPGRSEDRQKGGI